MRATLPLPLASLFLGCERHPSPPVAPASVPAQLDKLSRRGSANVPDVIQQLHAGADANLTWPETAERSTDYRKFPPLRAALIALLGDIGGEEAMAYLRELIATTRDPLELALAGRFLEEREPGRHREMLVTSARTLLAANPTDAMPRS